MAEAAGLAIGAEALAGLFNNAIECFGLIQIGRSFGKDFQTSQLRVDSAELRLSRWGSALELNELPTEERLVQIFQTTHKVDDAKALVSDIIKLFADAEGISIKYRDRLPRKDGSLAVFNARDDLAPAVFDLHNKVRNLSLSRQRSSGLRQKARWAVYEKKHLGRLIDDIVDLIDSLVLLFPAVEAQQHELCRAEVSVFSGNEALPLLKEIASEQDKPLEAALESVPEVAQARVDTKFLNSSNSGLQIGNFSGSMSGFTFGKGI